MDNTLPGWELAELKGVILWEHNMVHFSSTHPLQLWLYDLAGGRSQRIYPQANDPLRENFKRRLAAVIDQAKCQKNDWACDPDRFSSDVETVEVDEQSGAFAVQMVFSTEGFLTRDEAEESGAWTKDEYVYIYRLRPFAWRAFPIDDLRPKFGTDSLKELLTPEKLPAVLVQPR